MIAYATAACSAPPEHARMVGLAACGAARRRCFTAAGPNQHVARRDGMLSRLSAHRPAVPACSHRWCGRRASPFLAPPNFRPAFGVHGRPQQRLGRRPAVTAAWASRGRAYSTARDPKKTHARSIECANSPFHFKVEKVYQPVWSQKYWNWRKWVQPLAAAPAWLPGPGIAPGLARQDLPTAPPPVAHVLHYA